MNTSTRYQLFSIVVSIILSILIITIPSVSAISMNYSNYNYLEQVKANYDNYNDSLWSLGNGIQDGDYYSYKICNDTIMYQVIYPYHCYIINLEFVKLLESYKGDTWIVQSYFTVGNTIDDTIGNTIDGTIGDTIGNNKSPLILLIDPYTFHITTDPFNKKIGKSLEKTIFSLSTYGVQSLSIGTVWDEIDSYYTNKIPLEIKNKQSIQVQTKSPNDTLEVSVLSYDIIIPSNVYLHSDFPFPLKAKLYSPNIIYPEPQELYYFELLEYQSGHRSEKYIDSLTSETTIDTTIERLGGLVEK